MQSGTYWQSDVRWQSGVRLEPTVRMAAPRLVVRRPDLQQRMLVFTQDIRGHRVHDHEKILYGFIAGLHLLLVFLERQPIQNGVHSIKMIFIL